MSNLDLDYRPFDADNHYYEAADAFTRHVPKAMQPRCVQWAEINGRQHHIVGGKLAHAVVNPTWNPIAKPGAIAEYLRGNPNKLDPKTLLQEREPLPDYYMNNEARCAKLAEQGLEAIWLFPTLGVLYEELLKHDTEAVKTLFRGFNRWLDEDWGCNFKNRIFAAPYISLAD
ncbi:MAG: amidohydrolase, partial [Myxococcota bacterium]